MCVGVIREYQIQWVLGNMVHRLVVFSLFSFSLVKVTSPLEVRCCEMLLLNPFSVQEKLNGRKIVPFELFLVSEIQLLLVFDK